MSLQKTVNFKSRNEPLFSKHIVGHVLFFRPLVEPIRRMNLSDRKRKLITLKWPTDSYKHLTNKQNNFLIGLVSFTSFKSSNDKCAECRFNEVLSDKFNCGKVIVQAVITNIYFFREFSVFEVQLSNERCERLCLNFRL